MPRFPSPALVRRALFLLVPVIAIVVIAGILVARDQPEEALDLQVTEQSFASLSDLVTAADLVVVARAAQVRDGRVVASGVDSTSGVRTQFVTLEIGDVLDGATDVNPTLEQEYALTDGTPVTVGGAPPLAVNDEALLFLVRSKDSSAPYVAVVNAQSRYIVSGPGRDRLTPSGSDPLSTQLAALGPYRLRCEVLAVGDSPKRCDG